MTKAAFLETWVFEGLVSCQLHDTVALEPGAVFLFVNAFRELVEVYLDSGIPFGGDDLQEQSPIKNKICPQRYFLQGYL